MLYAENGTVRVGIDREMGASITWLSWENRPENAVNIHDPGRLIQQSYYAGRSLDRSADGQSAAWCPWPWNPIQGGGVGSWAKVKEFRKTTAGSLFAETVPKLWDMPDEDAAAVMRQETGFEPGFSNVVVVQCELVCHRAGNDRWGPAVPKHQELPALYFTRDFSSFQTYLGGGEWREEEQTPGPPWGRVMPPRRVMACFDGGGQGIAVFSPVATEPWNFGPHGEPGAGRATATDAPCVHLAPIATVKLGPKSTLRYRYWLAVGTKEEISGAMDALLERYTAETLTFSNL